ncbi:MAG TPA: motility protein A [Fibrobacteraceae bacterium]|nr:motility protein A [Fibrobacteraceae bacterium]
MDFATIGGLLAGIYFIVFWGIGDPGRIAMFIDLPSVAITLGGTCAAILVAHPFSSLSSLASSIRQVFIPQRLDNMALIRQFILLCEQARREGILSLEPRIMAIQDEYLRHGLQLVVDGADVDTIRNMMETELEQTESRHRASIQVMEDFGSLAPAFGMIGTLVGLVLMLANMSDPSTIGPAMAVALITTFYGSLLANLFCIPVAIKLRGYSRQETQIRTMMLDGVLGLQAGENPRVLEWKLLSYLSPDAKRKWSLQQGNMRRQHA